MNPKRVIRRLVWILLRVSGGLWAWRFLHRHEVTILFAHGVAPAGNGGAWTPLRSQTDPQHLDEGLQLLSRHYHWVSLDEAVDMIRGAAPVRPYSLAFTFDDGYRNNITSGLPIFQKHRIPVAVFVATGHIERREAFWFDRLDYALQHAPLNGRRVSMGGTPVRLDSKTRTALRRSYKELRRVAKTNARSDVTMRDELTGLAAVLEAESGRRLADILEQDEWAAPLTPREILEAARAGVTFGSHTVDHVCLTLAEPDVVTDQLRRSKGVLEQWTGRPCRHLAYPYGNCNPTASRAAEACGYASALTTEEGTNRMGDSAYALRRIPFPDTEDPAETLAIVSGLSDALSRLKHRLRTWCRASSKD